MSGPLWTGVQGTVTVWAISAVLAVGLAVLLTAGRLSNRRAIRGAALCAVNLTRGVPTSLLAITAGLGMMRVGHQLPLPHLFPGTEATFQQVAWGIVVALALGSCGHMAEIFRAAHDSLGRARLDEAQALGLSFRLRARLLSREAALVALPPTGTRLIHHLHNTAFVALFPVVDLFGYVQGQASASFRVVDYALLGALVYAALSGLIWLSCRGLEAILSRRVVAPRRRRALRLAEAMR